MQLRDYQGDLIPPAREGIRKHRAFMVQLVTGGGKTEIFSNIVNMVMQSNKKTGKKNKVWIIVPRDELRKQAGKKLTKHNVNHAFISAGMSESRAFDVHVVSKQTLDRRWDRIKNWPNLVIIDEAHLNFDFQQKLIEIMPETTRIIGFTATPERTDGTGLKENWIRIEKNEVAETKLPVRKREISYNENDGLNFTTEVYEKNIGGIYGDIVYGPSIPWMMERDFLAKLRYFAPPIAGLETLHWRAGEIDEVELDEFLEKRKVYGDVVKYYQKHGRRPDPQPGQNPNKPALIFCRSVKSAKETARHFNEAGFNFIPVWGNMPKSDRENALLALEHEKIDGICNCDLVIYGVDIPNLEYGASLRPTQSRNIYFQKVGRLLRTFPGKIDAVFFDHVNLVKYHQIDTNPGIPLFFLDDVQWNFEGRPRQKKKKQPEEFFVPSCPFNDYMICMNPACRKGCQKQKSSAIFWTCTKCSRKIHRDGLVFVHNKMMHPLENDGWCGPCEPENEGREELEVIADAKLKEIKAPVKFNNLAPEERREVQDGIGRATDLAVAGLKAGRIEPGPIGDLLRIAQELGRHPLWVYHRLVEEMKAMAVQAPLIYEIARQRGYKPGWAKHQIEALKAQKKETQKV
jgi:superfamily II DNA or RNA helicase